jgi:uncharacterized protein (DUF1778 family)
MSYYWILPRQKKQLINVRANQEKNELVARAFFLSHKTLNFEIK